MSPMKLRSARLPNQEAKKSVCKKNMLFLLAEKKLHNVEEKMKTWTQWQEIGLHTCTHVIAIAPENTQMKKHRDTETT